MLAIEVEYLTGCAVATNRQMRNEAEWPPHPQRLFAALVAALHECELGEEARAALLWLEEQPAPDLRVSRGCQRIRPETYVPVNDKNAQIALNRKKRTLKYMPAIDPAFAIGRDRKERHFPTFVPENRVVHFIWPKVDQAQLHRHRPSLESLCQAVAYLGHSSSLVRVAVGDVDDELTATDEAFAAKGRRLDLKLVERDSMVDGQIEWLRGIAPGRLQQFERAYDLSVELHKRREALDGPWLAYQWLENETEATARQSVFGDSRYWFVFKRQSGKPLPIHACLALTYSVRRALLSSCGDDIPKLLSGHGENDIPLERAHVAFLPMANVGYQYSDGELHGFSVVLPHDIGHQDRQQIASAIGDVQKVWRKEEAGDTKASGHDHQSLCFDWHVETVSPADRMRALQPSRYMGPSRLWATVTPMVFGHFLRKLDEPRTYRIIAECCRAIGLPQPKTVVVSPTSYVEGVPQSYRFPSLSADGKPVWVRYDRGRFVIPRRTENDQPVRMRYHVALEFDEKVRGPVVLGAGRFYGMGLCVPLLESRFPRTQDARRRTNKERRPR